MVSAWSEKPDISTSPPSKPPRMSSINLLSDCMERGITPFTLISVPSMRLMA